MEAETEYDVSLTEVEEEVETEHDVLAEVEDEMDLLSPVELFRGNLVEEL